MTEPQKSARVPNRFARNNDTTPGGENNQDGTDDITKTGTDEDTVPANQETLEPRNLGTKKPRNQDVRTEIQISGNQEIQKSGRTYTTKAPDQEYLERRYGGITDPDKDLVPLNMRQPLYVKRAFSDYALDCKVTREKLAFEILTGERLPIPKENLQTFKDMAQKGRLEK